MAKEAHPKLAYLHQCWSAVHTNQTLALEFLLEPPPETDTQIPVLMLHSQYSRFALGMIDNSSTTRKIMKANIRASEVEYFVQQYELALLDKRRFENEKGNAEESSLSPAYTVAIRAGAMKGQTPADILLADAGKAGELERHKLWLEGNLVKYPANQQVIDAIDDALYLLSVEELKADVSAPSTSCSIFREDFKLMNCSKDKTKKTYCKISVSCEFGQNNSWCFSIENGEHPLLPSGDVDRNIVENKRRGIMYLNDKEMANFVASLRNMKFLYENHVFGKAYDFVEANRFRGE